jgi:small-conductance mechanosensitive channel
VAVAIVLTTKELLMCLTGGFLRASTKSFDIGDWIKVNDVMGEVMSITTMTTLVEEIDHVGGSYQFTGRTVQIPNSKFLTINIENQKFLKEFIYKDTIITVQYADLNPAILMKELKKITQNVYAHYKDNAIKFNQNIEKKTGVDFADADPQFFIKTTDIGHNVYAVKFLIATKHAATASAAITQEFLSYVHKEKAKKEAKKEAAAKTK